LLADLGVTNSHSRPHGSNDNPYSETNFKTLKYWPDLPADIAQELGFDCVDLTEPSAQRRALPHLLETGPADFIAANPTLPQLRNEWPHLELSDVLRGAWEDAYPALIDDLSVSRFCVTDSTR
jgi:transposase InsO family protein